MKHAAQLYAVGAVLFLGGLVGLVLASAYASENPGVDLGILLVVSYTPVIAGIALITGATYRLFKNVDYVMTKIEVLSLKDRK